VLRVRATEPGGAVAGLGVNFGEAGGRSGLSACAVPLAGAPSGSAGSRDVDEFAVAHTFRRSGPHIIRLAVTVDPCDGSRPQTTGRVLIRNVRARKRARVGTVRAVAASDVPASAAQATGCTNTDVVPGDSNVAAVADATVCLLNAERAKVGLAAFSREPALERAADDHDRAMVQGRFFSHQGPGEPPLACGSSARATRELARPRTSGGASGRRPPPPGSSPRGWRARHTAATSSTPRTARSGWR
jgi:hypothetical protein